MRQHKVVSYKMVNLFNQIEKGSTDKLQDCKEFQIIEKFS